MAHYAAQSPRGFANEITVHRFPTRAQRNSWVTEHADDGDVNSSAVGAYTISARNAQSILGDKGDAATETFNAVIDHPDMEG